MSAIDSVANEAATTYNSGAAATASAVEGQQESLEAGRTLLDTGANKAATIGALYCAEGANQEVVAPGAGARGMKKCRSFFDAADALKKQQKQAVPGYQQDTGVSAMPAAQGTLAEFEKNFGVGRDDYFSRILGASSKPIASLQDLTGGRISAEKIEAALAAQEPVAPEPLIVKSENIPLPPMIPVFQASSPTPSQVVPSAPRPSEPVPVLRGLGNIETADDHQDYIELKKIIRGVSSARGSNGYLGTEETTLFQRVTSRYRAVTPSLKPPL